MKDLKIIEKLRAMREELMGTESEESGESDFSEAIDEDVELDEDSQKQRGTYWGRRAKDSKILRLKDNEAQRVVSRKASRKTPSDWLLIWWVPPEYAKEAKWRIEKGWIKPLWDWGKGPSKLKLTFDSVVKEDVELDEVRDYLENKLAALKAKYKV